MLSYTSLFSGCGGFDLGFAAEGFILEDAYDSDPMAIETFNRNHDTEACPTDVRRSATDIVHGKRSDVLIAGPPCQGFSTAGRRQVDDDRNHLLALTGEIAIRRRPKVLVVENVTGVLAGAHFKYWARLDASLRAAGYQTRTIKIQASQVGLAQLRQRAFLFCWRTGKQLNVTLPQCEGSPLRSVLANVKGVSNHVPAFLKRKSRDWNIARRIGPGQKLCNVRGGRNAVPTWTIPEVFGAVTPREQTILELLRILRRRQRSRDSGDADPVSFHRLELALGSRFKRTIDSLIGKGYVRLKEGGVDLVGTFNGKYRRLHPDRPSCTVDTRFGSPRYFLHPWDDRGFTVREAARIQGFPDSFTFVGSQSSQFRLVGNAVAPPVARYVAQLTRQLV